MRLNSIAVVIILMTFCRCTGDSTVHKMTAEDSVIYQQHAIAFIQQLYPAMDSSFVLDKIAGRLPIAFVDGLKDDSFFSKKEKQVICEKLYPAIVKWQEAFLPGVRLVDQDSLYKVTASMSYSKKWDYMEAHFRTGINTFAYPIFLRDYTYCLFYRSILNNGIGEGSLVLFKLKKGKWVIERGLWNWIT